MNKGQIENENSSEQEKHGLSPVLYRILSIQRDQDNPLLKRMTQDIISTEFYSEFKSIKEIPVWNQMRENAFKIIEEEFLQTIVQKGLTKETHKQLLQNNYTDYIHFFQRKIRYLISDLTFDVRFEQYIAKFNEEMNEEILLNLENVKKNLPDSRKFADFLETTNKHISLSFGKFFSRKIAVFLTSKEPYRKNILDYFAEFFHYLVVF